MPARHTHAQSAHPPALHTHALKQTHRHTCPPHASTTPLLNTHTPSQALPRAVTLLGAYLGFGMLGAVGAITWLSLSRGLAHPVGVVVQG